MTNETTIKIKDREVSIEPFYIKGSWVKFIDILVESGSVYEAIHRYEEMEGKKNLESLVVGWFGLEEFQWEVKRRFELKGFKKEEILSILKDDIKASKRIDEGQRASIGLFAKISGWMDEDKVNVMVGQSFDVRQADGSK